MKNKNQLIQPFVKWVGGKRQLMDEISKYIPNNYTRYYEPFLGGGAVLFNLEPKKAIVNDLNTELITVYTVIRDNVKELIEDLKKHENNQEYFYKIRALDRTEGYKDLSDVQKASRIIYLNKTCFNGLYRVNSSGQFNSPFGRYKNPNIVNEKVLNAVSIYLNNNDIKFLNGDFELALRNIRKGSFVYFDPPYDPLSESSNFTGYTLAGFNKEDQKRLKEMCDKLDKQGVKFLLSNSNTEFINQLYSQYKIVKVGASRCINSNAEKRGDVEELLIMNY